jgi:hypothetical protein
MLSKSVGTFSLDSTFQAISRALVIVGFGPSQDRVLLANDAFTRLTGYGLRDNLGGDRGFLARLIHGLPEKALADIA